MIRLGVVVAAAAVLTLAACGGDEIEPMLTIDGLPEEIGSGFSVRPALSELAPGDCSSDVPPEEVGVVCDLDGLAMQVGPAAVVGGVVDAQPVELRGGSWGVEIDLDGASAAALEQLSQEVASSDGRIAIVIGGEVVSAPNVAGVIGAGTLQVAGDWSEQVATDLAAQARR